MENRPSINRLHFDYAPPGNWKCEAICVVPECWPLRVLRRLRILPPRTIFPVTVSYVRLGLDVHNLTSEADAVGGWARMWDVDGAGKIIIGLDGGRKRTHYGKVEFRPG